MDASVNSLPAPTQPPHRGQWWRTLWNKNRDLFVALVPLGGNGWSVTELLTPGGLDPSWVVAILVVCVGLLGIMLRAWWQGRRPEAQFKLLYGPIAACRDTYQEAYDPPVGNTLSGSFSKFVAKKADDLFVEVEEQVQLFGIVLRWNTDDDYDAQCRRRWMIMRRLAGYALAGNLEDARRDFRGTWVRAK